MGTETKTLKKPKTLKANDYGVILQPTRAKAHIYYQMVLQEATERSEDTLYGVMRSLCLGDLFFLLIYVLKCHFADIDLVFERCREFQADPDGYVDLWSREHFKSTVITFAGTIQEILRNPEITIAIFSVTRPLAKQFLLQIKREFERNSLLKLLFPDVLWENPDKDAPKWSEDGGLIVKRSGNPKEATLEAWGLADDSQPTSKHYDMKVYDDVVTEKSVTNPEMIEGATNGVRLSMNLGKTDPVTGENITKDRFVGTRWDMNDSYAAIIESGIAIERRRPGAYEDEEGRVRSCGFWSDKTVEEKRRQFGEYIFACQILLDPKAASKQKFKEEWLKFWDAENISNLNLYLIIDPAGSKKQKDADFTVFNLFGVDALGNRMIVKLIRDKLNLVERTEKLFSLVREFPNIRQVGYEQIGMQSDIEHIEYRMKQENFRFSIIPLGAKGRQRKQGDKTIGGKVSKEDAIASLVAPFSDGRIWLPYNCFYTDYTGNTRDMVRVFINEEYLIWYPGAQCHDDMLDTMHMMFHNDLNIRLPSFMDRKKKTKVRKAIQGPVYSHRESRL